MNLISRFQTWWQQRAGADAAPFDADVPSWFVSMLVHMAVLLGLAAFAAIETVKTYQASATLDPYIEEDEKLEDQMVEQQPDEFYFSDQLESKVGANSLGGKDGMAYALAPNISEMSSLPSGVAMVGQEISDVGTKKAGDVLGDISVRQDITMATGPHFSANMAVRGAAGVGTTGAEGAIDRITHEILLSLEERKTLVVWFFDQTGSVQPIRGMIKDRFEKIYEELGVVKASNNPAFKRHDSKPLLTAAVGFGEKVKLLTPKPTDDVRELTYQLMNLPADKSGQEMVFSAVYQAADKFKDYRTKGDRRNIMFVVFTDEVGSDQNGLDATVGICRKYEIPVYVIGSPAPFGRKDVEIKWIDPDPEFDQTPQWVPIDQGPESYQPELVRLGFTGDPNANMPMDSGFGPYSLTRLCYETGGIYFTVHPNRNAQRHVNRQETSNLAAHLEYFFDPHVMRNYRPDYVSLKEYEGLVKSNAARLSLIQAAQFSQVTPMASPPLEFPKVTEADFANLLTNAQKQAAVLEPKVNKLFDVLKLGEKDRTKLSQLRWQAGYDLAMGRVLAVKVRTEAYNAMLAKAKQGMKFENPKNDFWKLTPAHEITVGSALEKQAKQAKEYLERVVVEHEGTPWAMLASRELKVPLGWKWEEGYIGVNAPKDNGGGGGGAPNPQDDKLMMLKKPPQKRPAPKL